MSCLPPNTVFLPQGSLIYGWLPENLYIDDFTYASTKPPYISAHQSASGMVHRQNPMICSENRFLPGLDLL